MFIRKLLASELAWANERYAEVDFIPSGLADLIATAEVEGVKAGLGRITPVTESAGELGGMLVFPEFRGHAVATKIVRYLLDQSDYAELFCIAFTHLDGFYQGFGFAPVQELSTVPHKVAAKFQWCQSNYSTPVVLLCRVAQRHGSSLTDES